MSGPEVVAYTFLALAVLFAIVGLGALVWAYWPTWRANKKRWDDQRRETDA